MAIYTAMIGHAPCMLRRKQSRNIRHSCNNKISISNNEHWKKEQLRQQLLKTLDEKTSSRQTEVIIFFFSFFFIGSYRNSRPEKTRSRITVFNSYICTCKSFSQNPSSVRRDFIGAKICFLSLGGGVDAHVSALRHDLFQQNHRQNWLHLLDRRLRSATCVYAHRITHVVTPYKDTDSARYKPPASVLRTDCPSF